MKISLSLLILFTLSLSAAFAKSRLPSKVVLIKCAQDIVDYGIGGSEGLRFAARTLQDLDFRRVRDATLLKDCINYSGTQDIREVERSVQLSQLASLRDALLPNVYFFLRGVIRPMIVCEPSGLLNKCMSATGKRWMETVIFDQRKTKSHYRLGHSTQGPIVRGIVEVNQDDLEYLESLPAALAQAAQESLRENENSRYLRIKVMKLKSDLKYAKHYFE